MTIRSRLSALERQLPPPQAESRALNSLAPEVKSQALGMSAEIDAIWQSIAHEYPDVAAEQDISEAARAEFHALYSHPAHGAHARDLLCRLSEVMCG